MLTAVQERPDVWIEVPWIIACHSEPFTDALTLVLCALQLPRCLQHGSHS